MTTDTRTGADRGTASPGTAAPRARPGQQLVTLAQAMLRGFFRDRTALFFTFFFPLMFLVVFGLVFRSGGAEPTRIGVVGDGPIVSALPSELFELERFDSLDEAVQAVRDGDLPAVVAQQGDEVVLRFAASDQVRAGTIQGVVSSVVDRANVEATGQPARFSLQSDRVEDDDLEAIQFITPGILSWGVATSAAFGAALTLVSWRKKQLLRRIRLSPAPVSTVVGARVGVSLVTALVQGALFVGIAMTPPFGLKLSGSWWLAIPLLLVGTLAFLSVGLLVGAIAKTEEAASAMANFVVLPMAFLSGTFFDISQAPGWLQAVSNLLPLRHMNDGMLDVLVRGQGIEAILLPCAVLLAFALVLGGLAARLFSWDDA
jgi:ABC-2 type transport system permease protein